MATKTIICKFCNRPVPPVKLVPSAEERAAKSGEPPSFYVKLFRRDYHTTCLIKERVRVP
jgi:hypothetical protein